MGGQFLHGITVFFDFYALLGVEKNSTREQIRKAYIRKLTLAQEHRPDYAPLFQLAGRTLTGENREQYDRELAATFRRGTIPVVRNPTPETGIRLREILDEDAADIRNHLSYLSKSRKTLGYSEEGFTQVQQKFTDSPTPENTVKYRRWLTAKAHLQAQENSFLWNRAGIKREPVHRLVSPEDYQTELTRILEEIKTLVQDAVAYSIFGDGIHPYLLGVPEKEYPLPDAVDIGAAVRREVTARAWGRIKQQAPALHTLAKQRGRVLEQMLRIMDWQYVTNRPLGPEVLVIVSESSWVAHALLFDLNKPQTLPTQQEEYVTERTNDVLPQFLDGQGYSIIHVKHDLEPKQAAVAHVLRAHAKRLGNTSVDAVIARFRELRPEDAPWVRSFY